MELITNFNKDNLDIKRIELNPDKTRPFVFIYTEKFQIRFFHYRYGPEKKTEGLNGINYYDPDIIEYAKRKYNYRLQRLRECNESPIFVIGGGNAYNGRYNLSEDKINDLLQIKDKTIICVGSGCKEDVTIEQKNNVYIIRLKDPTNWFNEDVAKLIYDKVLKSLAK